MNERDSEVIAGLLKASGYRLCDNDQEAEIVIFNTCSVRKHAEDRVWSLIGSYKGTKLIGLVGCMAQNYKEQAFDRDSSIGFVVGPQDIEKIPGIIRQLSAASSQPQAKSLFEKKIWETDGVKRPEEIYHCGFFHEKNHAYVVISEGCSNFCSYCVVPYVRGPLRHRLGTDILTEIRQAIDCGIDKVTLLGQNVNAYQDKGINFTRLLEKINALSGLKEFDFYTSHPKDASNDLFKAIRDLEKIAKKLHLPAQSGSDKILKLMNRGYTVKDYLALIDSYRKIVKGGLLTTDIIVGFPTETDKEFKETCHLVEDVGFNGAYIFKYSSRPGTEAAKISDQLERKDLEKRHKIILDIQKGISRKLRNIETHAKN